MVCTGVRRVHTWTLLLKHNPHFHLPFGRTGADLFSVGQRQSCPFCGARSTIEGGVPGVSHDEQAEDSRNRGYRPGPPEAFRR